MCLGEKCLVEYCSPTLAGLITGCLFRCSVSSQEMLNDFLMRWNTRLYEKGISLACLHVLSCGALIYVYREKNLMEELEKTGVKNFLIRCGYENFNTPLLIKKLSRRFYESQEFPHEIGVFLGYPLVDVIGFIENAGKNCKCSGCWKVYGDEAEAQKTFRKLQKCRNIYRQKYFQGKTILELAVA